jgi:hypothetical protein
MTCLQQSIRRASFPNWIIRVLCFIPLNLFSPALSTTGLPQAFLANAFCEEQIQYRGLHCTANFVMVTSFLSILVSPVNTVLMLAATYPYACPYEWMTVAWMASITGSFSPFENQFGHEAMENGQHVAHPLRRILLCGPFGVAVLFGGSYLLSYFHTSAECSVRLGECG